MNLGVRTVLAVLFAATPLAIVGCGGDGGEENETGEERASVDTESSPLSASSPSFADVASSETATVVASSSAPIVGDGFTISGTIESWQAVPSVVASGSEFLMLSLAAAGVRIDRSDDGVSWTAVPSYLATNWVGKVSSHGDRVVATGRGSDGPFGPPVVWETSDGGVEWTESPPLPSIEAPGESVTQPTAVTGLAVSDDRVVVLVLEPVDSDATDSMSGLGLVSYSFDGSAWTRSALSWQQGPVNNVVSGPAGFVALAQQSGTTEVMLSDDGITWSAQAGPAGLNTEWSLGGGPLGYVAAGAGRIAFSADGDTWEDVSEYSDLDPMTSGWMQDAGGAGGFMFVESSYMPGVPTRLFWSPDGRSWTETEFEVGDISGGPAMAVDDEMGLVLPFTVTLGKPPSLPVEPEG